MKEVNPETFTVDISGMNKRKAFAILKDFVLGDECYQGEILAVCGLKRTGKTTLLKQLLCAIDTYTASADYNNKCNRKKDRLHINFSVKCK